MSLCSGGRAADNARSNNAQLCMDNCLCGAEPFSWLLQHRQTNDICARGWAFRRWFLLRRARARVNGMMRTHFVRLVDPITANHGWHGVRVFGGCRVIGGGCGGDGYVCVRVCAGDGGERVTNVRASSDARGVCESGISGAL